MANFISEEQIEKAIIWVFVKNLGYRHVNCIDQDISGRLNDNEVVIKSILKERLRFLNPALPASAIEEAFEQLIQSRLDRSELAANKELYGLIKNGIQVALNNKQGKQEPAIVKVIDFDNESTRLIRRSQHRFCLNLLFLNFHSNKPQTNAPLYDNKRPLSWMD